MDARVRSTRGALNSSVVIALFCLTACDWPFTVLVTDTTSRNPIWSKATASAARAASVA